MATNSVQTSDHKCLFHLQKCEVCNKTLCNECFYKHDHIIHLLNENSKLDILKQIIEIIRLLPCTYSIMLNLIERITDMPTLQYYLKELNELKLKGSKQYTALFELLIDANNRPHILLNCKPINNTIHLVKACIYTYDIRIILIMCEYFELSLYHMVNLITPDLFDSYSDEKLVCLYELYWLTGKLPIKPIYEYQPSGSGVNISRLYNCTLDLVYPKQPDLKPEHLKFKALLFDSYKFRDGPSNISRISISLRRID